MKSPIRTELTDFRSRYWRSFSKTGRGYHASGMAAVEVAPRKLAYIKQEKGDTLRRVGLEEITAGELEELIHDKITSNYLYNLEINEQYGVTKFNIMIELPGDKPYKLVLALKYHPEHHRISLITCF